MTLMMILIFIVYKCYITVFITILSIHLCLFLFYFGGIFEFIYFKKYHIVNVNYFYLNYYVVLFFYFF